MKPQTPEVDLYWSFRSPYSYLVSPRLLALVAEWEFRVNVRVVLPIAVRIPDFFVKVNPLMVPYLLKDASRIAEQLELPYGFPDPDPVVVDVETRQAAKEQPYIHRLSRIGVLANEDGRGLEFVRELSGVIFGGVSNWHEGKHLARAADRAGCDLDDLDKRREEQAPRLNAELDKNQQAQLDAGHWGVPLMVFEGEPFFGQDRLDLLLWRMKAKGLKMRI